MLKRLAAATLVAAGVLVGLSGTANATPSTAAAPVTGAEASEITPMGVWHTVGYANYYSWCKSWGQDYVRAGAQAWACNYDYSRNKWRLRVLD